MPTVFNQNGYRFFFYSDEMSGMRLEPVHIHVKKDNKEAKFWISPVSLAYNEGFSRSDLRDIEWLVFENTKLIQEKWDDHFKGIL